MSDCLINIGTDLIDPEQCDKVKILDMLGVIRGGYLMPTNKPDRSGLVQLIDLENKKIIKVNPDRIIKYEGEGSIAIASDGELIAACPVCGQICNAENSDATCKEHGRFDVVGKVIHTKQTTTQSPIKTKETSLVDLQEFTEVGEVWVKEGVKFDDKTDVKTVALIISTRYITFNLYDNTYGKKGTRPPIEAMQNNEPVGYEVKNIDKLRSKLKSKGYNLLSSAEST